jgi:hypothetical protein
MWTSGRAVIFSNRKRSVPCHIQKFSAKRLEFPVDMAAATGPTSLPLTRR